MHPRICIICHNAYGAIAGGGSGHIGGAEHQTALLARWLAAQNYPVSLITWSENGPPSEMIDGVQVMKLGRVDAGLPRVRFFHPRLTGLYRALRAADADIYYHNAAEAVTGLAAYWCRRHRRRFVVSVASDAACLRSLPAVARWHERFLYRYGLRRANLLIVQTKHQQRLLESEFGLPSIDLPMPCRGTSDSLETLLTPPATPCVAWVGRLDPVKRLEWLLDVAELLPEVQFVVAAADNARSNYASELRRRAAGLENVEFRLDVARSEMAAVYRQSSLLCCTSTNEGFPNTFLEAWSFGRPIVTTFDPDALVATKSLGLVGHSPVELADAIRSLLNHPARWRQASVNARAYFDENHMLDRAMPRFEQAFLDVAKCQDGTPTYFSGRDVLEYPVSDFGQVQLGGAAGRLSGHYSEGAPGAGISRSGGQLITR